MSTYLYKDYFGSPKHKHDSADLLKVGIPITIFSSFGTVIVAPIWLWVLFIYGMVLVTTWGTLFILWRKFEKREAVTSRNCYISEEVNNFYNQWGKLEMDMRRELVDLYAGVYQLVKTGNEAFGFYDKDDEVDEMIDAIKERTRAVRSVVNEQVKLKVRLAKAGMIDLDSHAFETARLYAESFRQQAQELTDASD